jgi:Spy/CpxP family protein refolding chaperone
MERTMTDFPRPHSPGSDAPLRGAVRRRGWRLVGIAVAVAGILAVGACSYAPHGGWRDGAMSGQVDLERAARFTEKMADRVVSAVDGTPEQQQKITVIAQGAATDLMPLRERARTARAKAIALMSAPTIDRAAIETLRVEQIGLADTASKRIAQALADTAEVLSPEQRVKLAERMQRRQGRWS